MLELLLALMIAGLPAQDPPPPQPDPLPPAVVQSGDLTLRNAGMMAWNRGGQLEGQVMVVVVNAGAEADRVVSVSTPSGTVGKITVNVRREGRGVALPDGDTTIHGLPEQPADQWANQSYVVAELTDIASGRPMPVQTPVTFIFERAGAMTVLAMPTSPAPPPPP
ncbi:hypothetical protein [Brevundimonas sp.]|uniref:hypothetical protein n=1 Tax=Brevundimonas sp. TaxID=1871086 RepID=UPI002ABA8420|nr:hypothetical protein [Brevundimonas sp.]MDZ4362333.1 hypothetical protein [Brevundimonas sp.]